MNSPIAAHRHDRAFSVVLSGCRATFTNDFRRRSHRFQDVAGSLGFRVGAGTANGFLLAGQFLTLLLIVAGLAWTPPEAGLEPLGIPVTTPELAGVAGVLLAVALLQARRRCRRSHRHWNTVSQALDTGMRAGVVLLDAGLALMLIVQNLRWAGAGNILAALSLLAALALVLSAAKPWLIRPLAIAAVSAGAGSLVAVAAQAPWLAATAGIRGGGIAPTVLSLSLGLAVTVFATPLLYKASAHVRALQSRGLLIDLSVKSGSLFIFAGAALPLAGSTPWPWTAPFISLAVFFLGLVLFRSSFARISSPETAGYSLFLYRLAPHHIRPLIIRSLLTYLLLVLPASVALAITLVVSGYALQALLLAALVILETSIDALIIQRRTAILPASHISQLAQKSKAGLGAAVCAGVAVVFSGILGAVNPQATENPWLAMASGALVLVAGLLTGVVLADATSWLRELSATETEDA